MHALVFHGPRDIRYESYADPAITIDNAAILRVRLASICGSDLHIYHGDRIGKTDYSSGVTPFCVGHEFIGEVVAIGRDVHRFRVGDRVIAAPGTGCGTCLICRSRVGRCPHAIAFGLSTNLQGGQAELVQVPNADLALATMPEGITDEQAILMTDAMGTAQFGISRADIMPGDRVAIVGLGPIGLLGVELAFVRGASHVFAIDPVESRRRHAEHLGAIPVPAGPEARRIVQDLTDGAMVDRVFEASGARAAVDSVPGLLRHGGTASFIGLPQGDTALPLRLLLYKNLTVRAGVASPPETWPELVPLIQAGRIKGDGIVTHRLPLAQGAEGYRLFDSRAEGVTKIVFDVS